MRVGQLHDYFVGVGAKRLSAVDAEPVRSNQHEIGTTREMRQQFLGEQQHQQFDATYVWLGEDQHIFTVESTATHYNARKHTSRSAEWRLYYSSNLVTEVMSKGDALFLAMTPSRKLYFIISSQGSTSEKQLSWLFGLEPTGQSFVAREVAGDETELGFAAHFIFDEIGIDYNKLDTNQIDTIIAQFGVNFPRTLELSNLARLTAPEVKPNDDPDMALVRWVNHEEALFRQLERKVLTTRIEKGFYKDDGSIDIDGFMNFSLSVQNRRKSRMGRSLEHHLEAIFRAHDISYVRGVITENNHRPDFLFPSEDAYQRAPLSGHSCLTMLGAKSSCKDRWRQVLAEANKIPNKHLLTLEPSISEPQTEQMKSANLQLVIPLPIQETYTKKQCVWLWTLGDFIRDLKDRECK